jgi:hypothetical protein
MANCRNGSQRASESLKKKLITNGRSAAKLLEKKQNMLSCLLILILQQKGFVDEFYRKRHAEN